MRVTILTSSAEHPVFPVLQHWKANLSDAKVEIVLDPVDAKGGEFLFLISCTQIIPRTVRDRYQHTLVLHCSDLPRGRGWSPQNWEVAGGASELTATMLEAADAVDSGPIWGQRKIVLEGHELLDEVNAKWFAAELALMEHAIRDRASIVPRPQSESGATYYPRRTPEDSRLDPNLGLAAQFDLLRVCDNERYPAFFDHRGHRYLVRLEKADKEAT